MILDFGRYPGVQYFYGGAQAWNYSGGVNRGGFQLCGTLSIQRLVTGTLSVSPKFDAVMSVTPLVDGELSIDCDCGEC